MKKRFAVRVYKASHYVDIAVTTDNEERVHDVAIDLARSPKVKMKVDKEGTLLAVTLEVESESIKTNLTKTH